MTLSNTHKHSELLYSATDDKEDSNSNLNEMSSLQQNTNPNGQPAGNAGVGSTASQGTSRPNLLLRRQARLMLRRLVIVTEPPRSVPESIAVSEGLFSPDNRNNGLRPPAPPNSPAFGDPVSASRAYHPGSINMRNQDQLDVLRDRLFSPLRAVEASGPETTPATGSILPTHTFPALAANNNTNNNTITGDQGTVEENYWPNIINWLETGQGPRPIVNCAICFDNSLSIPGLHEEADEEQADQTGNNNTTPTTTFERHQILRCGHVFGTRCVHRWICQCLDSDRPTAAGPQCPICREPVYANEADLLAARRHVRSMRRLARLRVDGNGRPTRSMLRPAGLGPEQGRGLNLGGWYNEHMPMEVGDDSDGGDEYESDMDMEVD